MKIIKPGRRQLTAFLSFVFAIVVICSALEIQADFEKYDTHSAQTGSLESRLEFMLPISLAESQISNEIFIEKARSGPIQSRSRLLFAPMEKSLLLFGRTELWKHSGNKSLQYTHHLIPEISLCLGGHAPPAANYI